MSGDNFLLMKPKLISESSRKIINKYKLDFFSGLFLSKSPLCGRCKRIKPKKAIKRTLTLTLVTLVSKDLVMILMTN